MQEEDSDFKLEVTTGCTHRNKIRTKTFLIWYFKFNHLHNIQIKCLPRWKSPFVVFIMFIFTYYFSIHVYSYVLTIHLCKLSK